jgi:hypothetical protein
MAYNLPFLYAKKHITNELWAFNWACNIRKLCKKKNVRIETAQVIELNPVA